MFVCLCVCVCLFDCVCLYVCVCQLFYKCVVEYTTATVGESAEFERALYKVVGSGECAARFLASLCVCMFVCVCFSVSV